VKGCGGLPSAFSAYLHGVMFSIKEDFVSLDNGHPARKMRSTKRDCAPIGSTEVTRCRLIASISHLGMLKKRFGTGGNS